VYKIKSRRRGMVLIIVLTYVICGCLHSLIGVFIYKLSSISIPTTESSYHNHFNGMVQSSFLQRAWRLVELNVSSNSFTGPILPSLCINSSFVKLLNFSCNDHSGQIPWGLGACSKLKVFRAGFNSLWATSS
jgi:hypothetical protein